MNPILFRLAFMIVIVAALLSCGRQISTTTEAKVSSQVPSPMATVKTDTSSLLTFTSGLRAILEDSKGNIWFGSHQEGVAMYDGTYMRYFTEANGLSSPQVRTIYEDANGDIWFECGRGISRYDGQKMSKQPLRNYLMKDMWQAEPNDLWFKGDEMNAYNSMEGQPGVYRYDGQQFSYKTFPLDGLDDSKTYYSVSTPFVRGKGGRLWFGTYGAVFGYNRGAFNIIDDNSPGLGPDSGRLHIRSIHEDRNGNLWIGNNGIGVLLYDGEKISSISRQYGLRSTESNNQGGFRSPPGSLEHVFAIGEDADGNLWFGDRDTGAWRFDGKNFQNYTTEQGLSTHHIWQIHQSKTGEMWFAMGDGRVCRFTGEGFERIF